MFWKSAFNYKQPKTAASINFRIGFIAELLSKQTVTNTPYSSFTHPFNDTLTKEEAKLLFRQVKQHMGLAGANIQLEFFWEKPLETKENTGFIDTSELYRKERLKVGEYLENKDGFTIKLGMTTLKNSDALVFTMAHELAHYHLLGKHRLFFNDEKLTDIYAIRAGFGGYWLKAQNWEDTTNQERYSYLDKNEGLFTLGRLKQLHLQDVDLEALPNKCSTALKEAIDQTHGYNHMEIPYTEKFLIANFAIKVTHSTYVDAPLNDTDIYSSISTYNTWVKKGRGRLFKKKRTDIDQTVRLFLESHKKWVIKETDFLYRAEAQLRRLLASQQVKAVSTLTSSWKKLLKKHDANMDAHMVRYEKNSFVAVEEIVQNYADYKTQKTKDIYAWATTEIGDLDVQEPQ